MLSVDIQGADALDARLATLSVAVRDALARKIEDLAERLEQRIKDNLSGTVLQAESGTLRDLIRGEDSSLPPPRSWP